MAESAAKGAIMDMADFNTMLNDAIVDGGQSALGRVFDAARTADDMHEVFWTYSSLVAWQSQGIDKILQAALRGSTVKSKSAAITIFATLAVTGQLPTTGHYAFPVPMIELVNERIDRMSIRPKARHALRTLVLSLSTDDLLIPISQSFIHIIHVDPEITEEIVSALGTKWLRIGPPLLERYEAMFASDINNEPAFQEFFIQNPQILDPMAVQVWSQPDFHGSLEPDFVIRRADDTYLVVEIECPGKSLITRDNRPSREAAHAEAQALEYEDFLSSRIVEARAHFPKFRRADCIAVVGLERTLNDDQRAGLERANGRRQNARIVGFDWLLERAKAVVANIGEGKIDVIRRHRMI